MRGNEKGKRHFGDRVSIRWKLLGYLLFFLVFILLVVWFFQIYMLNSFYEGTKYREMKRVSAEISDNLGKAGLAELVYRSAQDSTTRIVVYRMNGGVANVVASSDNFGEDNVFHPASDAVVKLYENAVEKGGQYFTELTFGGLEAKRTDRRSDGTITACVTVTEAGDGDVYLILIGSSLAPFSATVQTLKYQFFWIAVILLVAAILLAILLSKKISGPLVRMSGAAQKLAKGDYHADFSGKGGYLETNELAETLNYAADELSKNDALQKELIANISHDLRTPLTMIEGYGEVMRDIPGENTPENVQVIIDETQRLSQLVNDLLDLSKLRAGTKKMEPVRVNLTELVRTTLVRYEKLTEHNGYRIEFHADGEAEILADRTMILQVVYNLINNAINYTGEDKRVTVTQTVKDGRVRIGVADTGEGIDKDQLPLIWDRYYKVDKVHRRAMIGTGLGLSIVKGILEMHGASYGVESTKGKGSLFWFEFPVAEENAEEVVAE